jgi:hypothetical protein
MVEVDGRAERLDAPGTRNGGALGLTRTPTAGNSTSTSSSGFLGLVGQSRRSGRSVARPGLSTSSTRPTALPCRSTQWAAPALGSSPPAMRARNPTMYANKAGGTGYEQPVAVRWPHSALNPVDSEPLGPRARHRGIDPAALPDRGMGAGLSTRCPVESRPAAGGGAGTPVRRSSPACQHAAG